MATEPPSGPARLLVVATDDAMVTRRLHALARDLGLRVGGTAGAAPEAATVGESPPAPGAPQPVAAVVDAQRPDALDVIGSWRDRWPDTIIAGHLAVPDRDRWLAAQRAGCDLVANRGAVVSRLRDLVTRPGTGQGRRFPLFDSVEAPGRLGLVYRTDDTPVGPVAVYHVSGKLYAVADHCPHAGASLAAGEVAGTVVTCPRHGSQFDVRTGERLRGPADTDIPAYPLVQEGGQVFLSLRETATEGGRAVPGPDPSPS